MLKIKSDILKLIETYQKSTNFKFGNYFSIEGIWAILDNKRANFLISTNQHKHEEGERELLAHTLKTPKFVCDELKYFSHLRCT